MNKSCQRGGVGWVQVSAQKFFGKLVERVTDVFCSNFALMLREMSAAMRSSGRAESGKRASSASSSATRAIPRLYKSCKALQRAY